jgi:hypothetical protein
MGEERASKLKEQAEQAKRLPQGHYRPELSVFAAQLAADTSFEDFLRWIMPQIPVKGKWVWHTTVEELEMPDEGTLVVYETPPRPYHYDVDLGDELTDGAIRAFVGAFGERRRVPNDILRA